jgi:hypothetical protein
MLHAAVQQLGLTEERDRGLSVRILQMLLLMIA